MFTNWKAVEEFLLSRVDGIGEDGRSTAAATKEEIEKVAGVELKFNEELKIQAPHPITLMWTKRPALPDGSQEEVIDFDHKVGKDTGEKPVRVTVTVKSS